MRLADLAPELLVNILIAAPYYDMLNLCQTDARFHDICLTNESQIYRERLKKDFPNWPIVGDPKTHYDKLVYNRGETYYYTYTPDHTVTLAPPVGDHATFHVPGNRLPTGTILYIVSADAYFTGLEAIGHTERNWTIPRTVFLSFTDGINVLRQWLRTTLNEVIRRYNYRPTAVITDTDETPSRRIVWPVHNPEMVSAQLMRLDGLTMPELEIDFGDAPAEQDHFMLVLITRVVLP